MGRKGWWPSDERTAARKRPPRHRRLGPQIAEFSYDQAADNDPEWRAEWETIGDILQKNGYGNSIIYSSETEKSWKKWHPQAEDMAGGESSNWKRAWRNMVDAVRSKAPEAEFAYTPFTGDGSGPDNGHNDMNDWYVDGTDRSGRPYMNYWGFTYYVNTQGTDCDYPCVPTMATYEQNLAFKMDPQRNWSIGQQSPSRAPGASSCMAPSSGYRSIADPRSGIGRWQAIIRRPSTY